MQNNLLLVIEKNIDVYAKHKTIFQSHQSQKEKNKQKPITFVTHAPCNLQFCSSKHNNVFPKALSRLLTHPPQPRPNLRSKLTRREPISTPLPLRCYAEGSR